MKIDQWHSRIMEHYVTDAAGKHHLICRTVTRGKRTSRGNRSLVFLWPFQDERGKLLEPSHPYMVDIGPGDVAGNHAHARKSEVFAVMGPGKLEVFLRHVATGKGKKITLDLGTKQFYRMVFVPAGVAHAVRNPSRTERSVLLVLADHPNVPEDEFHHEALPAGRRMKK
jgi:mannose-6-phosphate isomerase-like protein (cupin superfamily)